MHATFLREARTVVSEVYIYDIYTFKSATPHRAIKSLFDLCLYLGFMSHLVTRHHYGNEQVDWK